MAEIYGYRGKVLRVDLTNRRIETEDTIPKYCPKFLGGVGLCAKIMWDEIPSKIGPFDPENRLIFAPGALTGSIVPASGRTEVGGKSPHTYPKPSCTISGIGGYWGGELKQAGYDAVVLCGRADQPVYLLIQDERVEIRDAKSLWGLDTYETQKTIESDLEEPKVKMLTIGPAGENLVRFASIISGSGSAAGQGGFGAVMGSKKIKAIAVSGTGGVKIARPRELFENVKKARKLVTMLMATPNSILWVDKSISPTEINRSGLRYRSNAPTVPGAMDFVQKYNAKPVGCMSCPINCYLHFDVPGIGSGRVTCMQWYYAALKGECDEDVWISKILHDKLGINVYELYFMIPWLVEMNEKGLISEEDTKIPLTAYPKREFIENLLEKIAHREDFGDILAEGTCRAAEQVGEVAINYLLEDRKSEYGGHGMSLHNEPRFWIVTGLIWALHSRDPFNDQHDYENLVLWSGLSLEEQKAIAEKVYGSKEAVHEKRHPKYNEHEAKAATLIQTRSCVKSSLGLCDWVYPLILNPSKTGDQSYIGDTSVESKMFSAVTGIDIDEQQMYLYGERIWNLERAIMIREGRSREDDTLPPHFFLHKKAGAEPVDKHKFEQLKDYYYGIRGWDVSTGIPTKEKLEELELNDVADELGV